MSKLDEMIADFLAQRRIAVAGVSRTGESVGNPIAKKLAEAGHEVFPVNPQAEEIDGMRCYHDLQSIPGGIEAVVIATHPRDTMDVVRECVELGVRRVWMHRAFGAGSCSDEAIAECRGAGINVIAGACPMMYVPPVDVGHRCFKWVMKVTGKLPTS